MPFKIGDKVIPLDTPFTHNEIQFPSNWIRLATEEEKSAIGLVWEADPVRASDVFYWNGDVNTPKALEDKEEVDENGNTLYVKVYDPVTESMVDTTKRLVTKGLKSQFIAQVKTTAGSILAQTDWMITRKVERNIEVPAEVASYRAAVVAKADELETAIKAVTTVEELAALDMSFPASE